MLINVLGLDFGVAGTDGQVMNGHANEKIGDRDRGYNSPGSGKVESMGYSSNDNDNDGDDNQRPTSNAIRCNDDDERQLGKPLN